MTHAYAVLDVFTDTALAGNPLAVVLDADDLDAARMQAIAREFNLSETVFVLTPRDPVNSARVRIFTPARELPFAGHPTVGAAILLAQKRAPEIIARQDLGVVLEEAIGPVSCTVRRHKGTTRASFTLPRLPEVLDETLDPAAAAAALGLPPDEVGTPGQVPCFASAGLRFALVPVRNRLATDRAAPVGAGWAEVFGEAGVFVYTADTVAPDAQIHARMFGRGVGIHEDPATGSAVAALAGVLARALADGDHTVTVEQGFAMGRPSRIVLGLEIEGGRLVAASVGGAAVIVAEGTLAL